RLAVPQRVLVLDPLRDVAHAEHVEILPAPGGRADRDLRRELAAARAPRAERGRREIDDRIVGALRERRELLARRLEPRQERGDRLARQRIARDREKARGGRVRTE